VVIYPYKEGFGVTVKMGLAMPDQYCQAVMKEIEAGFRVILLASKAQFCMIPTTTLYDTCT